LSGGLFATFSLATVLALDAIAMAGSAVTSILLRDRSHGPEGACIA
jgi:hypothetical protein